MKNEKKWETKSPEWIHRVRQTIDEEIKQEGMTPAQWIRRRGKIDIKQSCHKMRLRNVTIISEEAFSRPKRVKQN
jgi:hypothetical protein